MMLPLTPEGGVSRERCRSYDRSRSSKKGRGKGDIDEPIVLATSYYESHERLQDSKLED